MIKKNIYLLNEPLSKHTTFKIGGPAKLWAEPVNVDELKRVLEDIRNEELDYKVIGNGSNILAKDKGIPWAIIKLGSFKELVICNNILKAGAGVSLNSLVRFSLEKNLSGLEFLAGIPGTVGGAIKTNTGAHGSEMADVIKEVGVVDKEGNVHTIPREKINFRYRYSDIREDFIILSAKFSLSKSSCEKMDKNIEKILEKRNAVFSIEYPNAGSIFKNINGTKAGELIDNLGLKGKTFGRAMVSEKHANIIVNLGGATAKDVKGLIKYIQDTVYAKTGMKLELEIECW